MEGSVSNVIGKHVEYLGKYYEVISIKGDILKLQEMVFDPDDLEWMPKYLPIYENLQYVRFLSEEEEEKFK